MNKTQKIAKIIALALGICMVISGVVFLFQSNDHTGHSGGLTRASTSIKFGADYYTTSAQNTGLTANAVSDLYDIVKNAIGLFFIFVGGTDCCVVMCFPNRKEPAAEQPIQSNESCNVDNPDSKEVPDEAAAEIQ